MQAFYASTRYVQHQPLGFRLSPKVGASSPMGRPTAMNRSVPSVQHDVGNGAMTAAEVAGIYERAY